MLYAIESGLALPAEVGLIYHCRVLTSINTAFRSQVLQGRGWPRGPRGAGGSETDHIKIPHVTLVCLFPLVQQKGNMVPHGANTGMAVITTAFQKGANVSTVQTVHVW